LLSNTITNPRQGGQEVLGGLDVTVERNAFGSQKESFFAKVSAPPLKEASEEGFNAAFIRAPRITSLDAQANPSVQVLATVNHHLAPGHSADEEKEIVVAVRQANRLGTAFHPELTDDDRWHRYFLEMLP
jgi:5'-phosphate synthase pdxT subunit